MAANGADSKLREEIIALSSEEFLDYLEKRKTEHKVIGFAVFTYIENCLSTNHPELIDKILDNYSFSDKIATKCIRKVVSNMPRKSIAVLNFLNKVSL